MTDAESTPPLRKAPTGTSAYAISRDHALERLADHRAPVGNRVVRAEGQVPVRARRADGGPAVAQVDRDGVGRLELACSEPDRLRVDDAPESEELGERLVVDARVEPRPQQQRLQLGREHEAPAGDRVVEGLLACAVAGAEQAPLLDVPDREREHPREVVEARLAPGPERLDEDLGVRRRAEPGAQSLQLGAQRLEVVELAVVGDDEAAVTGAERLIGRGRGVDHDQPAATQAHAFVVGLPEAGCVGASVHEAIAHLLDDTWVDAGRRDDADDAAHQGIARGRRPASGCSRPSGRRSWRRCGASLRVPPATEAGRGRGGRGASICGA